MVQKSIRVDLETFIVLQALRDKTDRPKSWIIKRLVTEELNRIDNKKVEVVVA